MGVVGNGREVMSSDAKIGVSQLLRDDRALPSSIVRRHAPAVRGCAIRLTLYVCV